MVLANGSGGSATLGLLCDQQVEGGSYRYFFSNFAEASKVIVGDKQIGFAVAEQGGHFRVVRFSMAGASQALKRLETAAREAGKSSTADLQL